MKSFRRDATVVVQSHRSPLPYPWLHPMLESVRGWSSRAGFAYCFLDDELFDELTPEEQQLCQSQPVVASDLARLRWCQRLLRDGAKRVVWCDADTLILNPDAGILSAQGTAFGREIWLQAEVSGNLARQSAPKLKRYKKIHNAFMQFGTDDPVLDFYAYAAQRLISNHQQHSTQPIVAQLAGPKFLTHLHNVLGFDVLESAQVLSPPLAMALLEGDLSVLRRYVNWASEPAAALNFCCSEVERGNLTQAQVETLVELLLARGASLFGGAV